MFAFCPSCRQPAALDLHASMFHPSHDTYSCADCRQSWHVDKRTGQMLAPVPSPRRRDDAPDARNRV
jgi:hypothetical protein